jgi:Icc-related predicted phosphoesterase
MYWIVVGDIHESSGRLGSLPGIAQAEGLIISGDMTNRGGADRADRVLAAALNANPRVLAQVGNMDLPEVTGHLAGRGLNIHREAILLAPGLALMGVGYSNPTPFGTPSEASEEELAAWLAETHAKAKALAGEGGRVLAIIHTPPKDTLLDRLPGGMSVGSPAVRAFIEREQPAVCVCGHIHEAYGEAWLGKSHVLNPGMLAEGGFVRVELADGELSACLGRA